jgi:hypothetical protein
MIARNRLAYGGALLVVIVLGLLSRSLGEHLPKFIADNAGDALWTVAVYLTLAIVLPRCPALRLGIAAFGISLAVELSQLIQVAWLNALRQTLPGRLLLGAGFLWIDLVRYGVGALAAAVIDPFGKGSRAGD